MTDRATSELRHARPFPGLRYFTEEEAHLFFGREGQSNTIIRLLEQHGFVAVVGSSGCGKSSLVHAGVLPSLLAGYAVSVGSSWQVADCRPGSNPIGAVATELARRLQRTDTDAGWLRRGSTSIVDAVRQARAAGTIDPDDNVLILIDQFEELFRYKVHDDSPSADRDEKAEFVALLLKAIQDRADRIFVALTMRSDFLGDCAQFRDLPEQINSCQYLVPRMTRQQRRLAIEGPVRVVGGAIAPRLVQRLLNEVGDDEDQLPLLQHALMRTWDFWAAREPSTACVDIEDYESIGSLRDALGTHAEEALKEVGQKLGDRGETIVKQIFQRLRIRDANGRETRSPATVRDLITIGGASLDDLRAALDAFRDDERGRSFVVPLASVVPVLQEETRIDVTHESLLRCWPRLAGKWVREEEDARRIYTRLAERAEEEGAHPQNLLGGTLLQRAAEWWDERQPNRVWAERYHNGFDAAGRYLTISREASREAAKRQQQQAEETRRAEEARKIQETRHEAEIRQSAVKRHAAYVVGGLGVVAAALVLYYALETRKAAKVARSAREAAVIQLLASKSALASHEGGRSMVSSLLLAAESLRRTPSLEAQVLASSALALIPPVSPWPVTTALDTAFSGAGPTLAVLGEDGVVQLWDLETKTRRGSIGAGVQSFAIARAAPRAVTLTSAGVAAIWNTETFAKIIELPCARASGKPRMTDNAAIVAALCGGKLFLWKTRNDWQRSEPVTTKVKDGRWTQMALSGNGLFVALADIRPLRSTTADDGESTGNFSIVVQDVGTGKLVAADSFSITPTAFDLFEGVWTDAMLAVGDATGLLRLWNLDATSDIDLETDPPATTLKLPGSVTAIAQGASRDTIIAGSRDGVATVWSGGQPSALLIGEGTVTSAAVIDDDLAVIVDRAHRAEFFALGSIEERSRAPGGVGTAQFSSDGSQVLLRDRRQIGISTTTLFDVVRRKPIVSWNRKAEAFYPVALGPDLQSIAVRLEAPTGQSVLTVKAFREGRVGRDRWARPVKVDATLSVPLFSRDSAHLAAAVRPAAGTRPPTAPERLGLFVWNAATGVEEVFRPFDNSRSTRAPVFCFAGTAEQRMVFTTSDGIREIAFPSLAESASLLKATTVVTTMACSPSGGLVAIAESGGNADTTSESAEVQVPRVRVLEFPSGREVGAFDHPGTVRGLTFDREARFLTVVGADSVSLWDLTKPDRPTRFPTRRRPLAAALTPDGTLVVADETGVIYLRWRPEDLIKEACRRAGRELTPREWQNYMGNEPQPMTCGATRK